MKLIIDIGNSGAKVAVARKNRLVAIQRFEQLSVEALTPLLERYQITAAIYASVAASSDNEKTLLDWLNKKIDKVILFNHQTPLPINNNYATPETLGADRVAAAAGANLLFPHTDCVVIDCGTAITIDFLNSAGEFLGGNISPGLQTRFKALNTFTGRLPLGYVTDQVPEMGVDTISAISAGVLQGALLEIEGYMERNPHSRFIITGGDALFFAKNIKNPIFVVYNLVLIGLNRILDHNANII